MFVPPSPDQLHHALSNTPQKLEIYRNDFYYEWSFNQALNILQDEFLYILKNTALLLIKPDANIMNRIPIILRLLDSNGYELLYVARLQVTHTQATEMWKYQWSAATIDRIIVNEKLMELGPSFFLLLRNRQHTHSSAQPLSAYLTEQKGAANKKLQKAENFRAVLKPLNIILNYIHTADEPADVIREIGVLVGIAGMADVYSKILAGNVISYESLPYKKHEVNIPVYDPKELLLYLWRKAKTHISKSSIDILDQHLHNVYQNKCHLDLSLLLATGVIKQWTWEWIVAASHFIQYNTDNQVII